MSEIDITKTKVAPLEPDLEKLRDEKCIPVARSLLTDLSTDLLPQNANDKIDYNPILTKFLQKTLDADMNIQTEAPYIFQLLLGVLSGLNLTVQGTKTVPIDEIRYATIGRKILAIVAEANVKMGSVTPDETTADFAPVKEKIDALVVAENLSMLEVKYIMDNIFDSFKMINDIYLRNIEQSTAHATAKLFGLESLDELGLKKLDEVLKAEVKPAA